MAKRAKGAVRRWMYQGQRPNWIARLLNRVDAAVGAVGIGSRYGLVSLEVSGRTTGRTITLPVAVIVVDGQRYVVSMLGEHVQWVRNVRAAGGRAVIHSGRREPVHLVEVAVDQRAPILKAYLRRAPGARAHMPVERDAPLADFERIAPAYPVFHVTAPASA